VLSAPVSDVTGRVRGRPVVAVENSLKELLFVFFLVLVPTVPVAVGMVLLLRSRRRQGPEALARGRAETTPFRLISIVGSAATLAVLAALLLVIGVRRLADTDESQRAIEPVVDGGTPGEALPDIPQQGNAGAGAVVFQQAGCGDCHALLAAKATGATGPNLDESNPDFSKVVEYVTKGRGEMPSFLGRLSATEIRNVAKYVATVTPEDANGDDDQNDQGPP
jgi:mono/diheme cytochrome c family protein